MAKLKAIQAKLEALSQEADKLPFKKRKAWLLRKRATIKKLFHRLTDEVVDGICEL